MSTTPDFFSVPVFGKSLLVGFTNAWISPGASGAAPVQVLPQSSTAPTGGLEVQRLMWNVFSANATSPYGTPSAWGFLWAFIGTGNAIGTAGQIDCTMVDGWPVGAKYGNPWIKTFADGEFIVPSGNALFLGHSFPGAGTSLGLDAYVEGIGATG